MNGHVSLTSDAHNTHLVQTFGDLFRKKILTDVTLLCEDRVKIEAHKVVLCAGSNFFREFFTHNTNHNLILYMRGIPKHQLMPLVEFLYCGETTVPNNQVQEILNVAKELEITTLDEDKLKDDEKLDCVVKEKQNLEMLNKDSGQISQDSELNEKGKSIDIFDTDFASSMSELSCENCNFFGLNKESLEKHKKLAHRENINMNISQNQNTQQPKKEISVDRNGGHDDLKYFEPHLVLKQTPRSPYWPFFKFVGTELKGPSKMVHCMACLDSYDVRLRKKDILWTGGTSSIKSHMERFHKDFNRTSFLSPYEQALNQNLKWS